MCILLNLLQFKKYQKFRIYLVQYKANTPGPSRSVGIIDHLYIQPDSQQNFKVKVYPNKAQRVNRAQLTTEVWLSSALVCILILSNYANKGLLSLALLNPSFWLLLLSLALVIMKTLFQGLKTWLCHILKLLILTFTFALLMFFTAIYVSFCQAQP